MMFEINVKGMSPRHIWNVVHTTPAHLAVAGTSCRIARAVATAGGGILWTALWKIALSGQLRVDGEREGGQ